MFRDMRTEMKTPPSPEKVAAVAAASGTHLLKMLNKNVPLGNHVLRAGPGDGSRGRFLPSPNAADSPIAKMLFRPIAVTGVSGQRTLVDHIVNPDELSPDVLDAFSSVFGPECRTALDDALAEDRVTVDSLHDENFPIVFVPGADGDVQLTPIPAADTWFAVKEVMDDYFRKVREGEEYMAVRRGARRTRQEVSSKMQNISPALGGRRIRFLATFPGTMTASEAGVWRYARGGRAPMLQHPEVADLARAYLRLHLTQAGSGEADGYSNRDIREGARNLARWLVALARDFIAEINERALEINPDFEAPEISPVTVILRRRWRDQKEQLAVRSALESPDFLRHLEDEQ
ncbi:hypothetical protein LAZ40_05560 [Cereibacter sphaeroides]|uniref:hypothetical protein n=1 Tax=Cereibacter sphaeroides TaxID=1063 RepID=UPI001F2616D7|nr:hypothetical protein [Cereibacter sphaeroides]MCE6958516.1 hypothetical protein [Cereibacter sphaeroides]MCE6972822.1 hypothetical protein [Cereibacter sphaeroides]